MQVIGYFCKLATYLKYTKASSGLDTLSFEKNPTVVKRTYHLTTVVMLQELIAIGGIYNSRSAILDSMYCPFVGLLQMIHNSFTQIDTMTLHESIYKSRKSYINVIESESSMGRWNQDFADQFKTITKPGSKLKYCHEGDSTISLVIFGIIHIHMIGLTPGQTIDYSEINNTVLAVHNLFELTISSFCSSVLLHYIVYHSSHRVLDSELVFKDFSNHMKSKDTMDKLKRYTGLSDSDLYNELDKINLIIEKYKTIKHSKQVNDSMTVHNIRHILLDERSQFYHSLVDNGNSSSNPYKTSSYVSVITILDILIDSLDSIDQMLHYSMCGMGLNSFATYCVASIYSLREIKDVATKQSKDGGYHLIRLANRDYSNDEQLKL